MQVLYKDSMLNMQRQMDITRTKLILYALMTKENHGKPLNQTINRSQHINNE